MLSLFAVSCGYGRESRGVNLPEKVRRVAVPVFRNDTTEAGLEAVVTDAVRREFLLHRFVGTTDMDNADAVVVGIIRKFSTKPISFSEGDFAVEYRASIQVSLAIVLPDGVPLWTDRNINEVQEYRATPDIFESEANKASAIRRMAEDLARDFHARVFDGFPQ
ncbi:hypothetical protein K8I61_19930 [bacterium]|nr:hypothetical protein [bacterium]